MRKAAHFAKALGARLRAPDDALRSWLVAAGMLHACLAAALALHGRQPHPRVGLPGPPVTSPGLLWIDHVSGEVAAPGVAAYDPAGARPSRVSVEPQLRVTFGSTPVVGAMVDGAPAIETGSLPHLTDESADPRQAASEPISPEVPSGAGEPTPPRLSLRDLGVGREHNPFARAEIAPPSRSRVLNERLRHSLQSELTRRDQALGLGPEGPAVAAIKSIVSNSATTNTSGLLSIRTDATGLVVHVEVLDTSSDALEWTRIADELKGALAHRRLRVPARSAGVTMKLRVVSRIQMPSGTDPGFSVDIFGQRLREGGGDRSAGLELFSSELIIQEVEVPYTEGRHTMASVSVKLGGLKGDLADIGAVAQRIVSAQLVAMETHSAVPTTEPALRGLP